MVKWQLSRDVDSLLATCGKQKLCNTSLCGFSYQVFCLLSVAVAASRALFNECWCAARKMHFYHQHPSLQYREIVQRDE